MYCPYYNSIIILFIEKYVLPKVNINTFREKGASVYYNITTLLILSNNLF